MSINLNDKRNLKLESFEKTLADVFPNKTSGLAVVLEAWTFLRRNTIEKLEGKLK